MASLRRLGSLSWVSVVRSAASRITCARVEGKMMHLSALFCHDVDSNPFYDKYRDKLSTVLGDEPLPKVKDCSRQEELPLDHPPQSPFSYTTAPSLNSVMRVELIMDKSKEEIAAIWEEYHKTKDCVGAVLPSDKYIQMYTKASHCPLFVYPIPRGEGVEMMFAQISGHRCYFTSLINYQMHAENAPICLTLTYYTDFQEDKGIVLMLGEVDTKSVSILESQYLANQVQLYYCSDDPDRYNLVRQFNHDPDNFDYKVLLDQLQNPTVTLNQ